MVLSPHADVVEDTGKLYAGRASSTACVDLFITLLSMGMDGYKRLLIERQQLVPKMREHLIRIAKKHGERLLDCRLNSISFGITLGALTSEDESNRRTESKRDKPANLEVSSFGAMLYSRCVSGTRVVPRMERKTICGINFEGFGSSTDDYPFPYMTAACAIGLSENEL